MGNLHSPITRNRTIRKEPTYINGRPRISKGKSGRPSNTLLALKTQKSLIDIGRKGAKKLGQKTRDAIKINRSMMISFKNKKKEQWDMLILVLAVQNSMLIPIDMSFEPVFNEWVVYKVFDTIIDLFFLFDMILMCVTTHLNK